MKVCFPVAHDRGLESRVYPHFGFAPLYLVVDGETKAAHAIANPEWKHGHRRCRPLDLLAGEKIDAAVVSGIGPGALDRLLEARIPVYHASRGTVAGALDAIAHGTLPPAEAHGRGDGRGPRRQRHRHRHGRA